MQYDTKPEDKPEEVVVLVVSVDYELQIIRVFQSMNTARIVALQMANEYYNTDDDRTFISLNDAWEYEKSEEWWDNDDRCTIELQTTEVEKFTGRTNQ